MPGCGINCKTPPNECPEYDTTQYDSNYWNYVETIGILLCKQISSNSFKNEIIYKLFTYKSHVYPFNCVQTNDK